MLFLEAQLVLLACSRGWRVPRQPSRAPLPSQGLHLHLLPEKQRHPCPRSGVRLGLGWGPEETAWALLQERRGTPFLLLTLIEARKRGEGKVTTFLWAVTENSRRGCLLACTCRICRWYAWRAGNIPDSEDSMQSRRVRHKCCGPWNVPVSKLPPLPPPQSGQQSP